MEILKSLLNRVGAHSCHTSHPYPGRVLGFALIVSPRIRNRGQSQQSHHSQQKMSLFGNQISPRLTKTSHECDLICVSARKGSTLYGISIFSMWMTSECQTWYPAPPCRQRPTRIISDHNGCFPIQCSSFTSWVRPTVFARAPCLSFLGKRMCGLLLFR